MTPHYDVLFDRGADVFVIAVLVIMAIFLAALFAALHPK